MHAAVVTSFSHPPRYLDHPEPVARGRDEMVVDVLAAALHPRVRSQAGGSHYTSTGELPLVPGIDAVVRDPRGRIRYTVLDDTALGSLADRTVIEAGRSVVLPGRTDPVQVAAAMNPLMSSWVALRRRIGFRRGGWGRFRRTRPSRAPGPGRTDLDRHDRRPRPHRLRALTATSARPDLDGRAPSPPRPPRGRPGLDCRASWP
jgi:hypothetical protein